MIKDFLQFIKKTKFAVKLARAGLFPLIKNLKTFRFPLLFAIFFCRKNKNNLHQNLDSFYLEQAKDKVFCAFVDSMLSVLPLFGYPLYFPKFHHKEIYKEKVVIKNNHDFSSYGFYLSLLRELVKKDFPQAYGLEKDFKKQIDIMYDFRLWGAELEELKKDQPQSYEINWPETSQDCLSLSFLQTFQSTQKLSAKAQENFVNSIGHLIFDEKFLIANWQDVLCNQNNETIFLQISPIKMLSPEDLLFIKQYLQKKQKPLNLKQSQIVYSIEKLRAECPKINLEKAWAENLRRNFSKKQKMEDSFFSSLKKHGVVYAKENNISFPSADSLKYLLDSSRHKKDKRYKKSSLLYVLLLLLAYLFCKNF